MKHLLAWLSAAFFAVSLALAWAMLPSPEADLPPPPQVPAVTLTALFDATLPDTEARPQPLAQWRGRVLVVNYWATWCTPCRDEMPAFSRLQAKYGRDGVQFVGIAIDELQRVRDFAREVPVAYPLLIADKEFAETARALGNGPLAVPYTVVIDREGKLRAGVLGRVQEEPLARLLSGLI